MHPAERPPHRTGAEARRARIAALPDLIRLNPSHDYYAAAVQARLELLVRENRPAVTVLFRCLEHQELLAVNRVPPPRETTLALVREGLDAVATSSDSSVGHWTERARGNIADAERPPAPDERPLTQFSGLPRAGRNSLHDAGPRLGLQHAIYALMLDVFQLPDLGSSAPVLDGALAVIRCHLAGDAPRVRRATAGADANALRPYRGAGIAPSWDERAAVRAQAAWRTRERLERQRPPQQRRCATARRRRAPSIRHRSSLVSAITAAGPPDADGESNDGDDGEAEPAKVHRNFRQPSTPTIRFDSSRIAPEIEARQRPRLIAVLRRLLDGGSP